MDSSFIVVGKIGKPFGIKGWQKIHSFTDSIDRILSFNPWYLKNKTEWKEIQLEDGKLNGTKIVAKLSGIETPEEARFFTNLQIGVKREKLYATTTEKYCWSELEGLTVITTKGITLGKVIALMKTRANDVIVVQGERERLLPYLPKQVVIKLDMAKSEMIVDWDPNF